MKKYLLTLLCCFGCVVRLLAANDPDLDPLAKLARLRKLSDGLQPQWGQITLPGGIASITVTRTFRYLTPADTTTVLSSIWGNPSTQTLGMLVPVGFDPLSRSGWAVVISYSKDGYVKDSDASSIDYDKMMAKMKDGMVEANKERTKAGYPPIELLGWAAPPRYDPINHKLYWAKRIKFGNSPSETLNYGIRILGRRGVLVLNAVAAMPELPEVEQATPAILAMVNFKDGERYADFNSKTDKVAEYGLAALIIGGVAAKAGLFKLILIGLLAAKKFILLAVVAIMTFFKKLFRRKKNPFAAPTETSTSPPPS